jgi:hypothetical protein
VSELIPCSECNRHVRMSDMVCPFCAAPQPARATLPETEAPRARLSRTAIFAAGAALAGMSACSSTANPADSGAGGAAAGTGGVTGGAGGAGGAATPDGGRPDGPVPIYSAVFPPAKPSKRRNG